jgi:hypothetical protein
MQYPYYNELNEIFLRAIAEKISHDGKLLADALPKRDIYTIKTLYDLERVNLTSISVSFLLIILPWAVQKMKFSSLTIKFPWMTTSGHFGMFLKGQEIQKTNTVR